MAITTDPTPLADLLAAIDAAGEVRVYLSPACIASFGGGSHTFTAENVGEFTFREDDEFLFATGENGKEFVVEM
jgi:hypothetical protein